MMDLLGASETTAITMEALSAGSGVSKQTLYRWWPTKAAVIAEALSEKAREAVPSVDTGSVDEDVTAFLRATFAATASRPVTRALQTLLAEAQTDPHAAAILDAYTGERRQALTSLLKRGQRRGELRGNADLGMIVDQAFGFVWYHLAVRRRPPDSSAAAELTRNLLCHATFGSNAAPER
jgi:AcrR family transcriptional regulator